MKEKHLQRYFSFLPKKQNDNQELELCNINCLPIIRFPIHLPNTGGKLSSELRTFKKCGQRKIIKCLLSRYEIAGML